MKKVKLDNYVDILSGFAFKSSQFNDNKRGLPIVRIRNVKPAFSETYYDGEFNEKFLLNNGDILIGMDGEFNCEKWQGGKALLNQRVCRIKSISDFLDDQYLFYYLSPVLKIIEGKSNFVTVKHLSVKQIQEIKIPLPPIASQRRIADILDKADEIIRKRKEAIALTEQLQKSIFLDMFGDPVINPKGWEVEELNNVISIISGQVDPKVEPFIDMPHIGGENLQSNTNNIQNIKTPRELKLKSGKYLFQSGNVLYSKIRPYLNQVVITDFSGVCSADIYPLRVIETKIKNDFLIYLLRSKFFLDYAQKHSTRTNIPKINRPTLLSFRFPCPPINIQKDFSDTCNKITQIQKNFNQYLTESENLFNSLLQKAFKGEL